MHQYIYFRIDNVHGVIKDREVRSEERKSIHMNPRRNIIKNQFQQRPIVPSEKEDKKLYYLQFLSGQPVWGLVRNCKDSLNDKVNPDRSCNGIVTFLIYF